jgi:hypothetical protein
VNITFAYSPSNELLDELIDFVPFESALYKLNNSEALNNFLENQIVGKIGTIGIQFDDSLAVLIKTLFTNEVMKEE